MVQERRQRRKTKFRRRVKLYTRVGMFILITLMVVLVGMKFFEVGPFSNKYVEQDASNMRVSQPKLDVQLLTINPYSRPGTRSDKINNVVKGRKRI